MQAIESRDSWQNESTSARPLAPGTSVSFQPTDASLRQIVCRGGGIASAHI